MRASSRKERHFEHQTSLPAHGALKLPLLLHGRIVFLYPTAQKRIPRGQKTVGGVLGHLHIGGAAEQENRLFKGLICIINNLPKQRFTFRCQSVITAESHMFEMAPVKSLSCF